jgi:hypothetical protein
MNYFPLLMDLDRELVSFLVNRLSPAVKRDVNHRENQHPRSTANPWLQEASLSSADPPSGEVSS